MNDLGFKTPCPKCGYDPTEQHIESFRHIVTYDRDIDMMHLQCPRCGWSWKMPCNDAKGPDIKTLK